MSKRPQRAHPLSLAKYGNLAADYGQVAAFFDAAHDYESFVSSSYPAPETLARILQPWLPTTPVTLLDFGCGTGLSGAPLMALGHSVHGVDVSASRLAEARQKGYEWTRVVDLAGTVRLGRRYAAAISVGVGGDWIPADLLLRKMIGALRRRGRSWLALTLEDTATNQAAAQQIVLSHGFEIVHFEHAPGWCDSTYSYMAAVRGGRQQASAPREASKGRSIVTSLSSEAARR